jgi:tRNA modification GTPase
MKEADLIVAVLDGADGLTPDDELLLARMDKKMIIVINKDDLPGRLHENMLERFPQSGIFSTSATLGSGIERLKQGLRDALLHVNSEAPVVITNLRHKSALVRCRNSLSDAQLALEDNRSVEFIAIDLSDAKEALEEIVGKIDCETILERIFSQFCIGK